MPASLKSLCSSTSNLLFKQALHLNRPYCIRFKMNPRGRFPNPLGSSPTFQTRFKCTRVFNKIDKVDFKEGLPSTHTVNKKARVPTFKTR